MKKCRAFQRVLVVGAAVLVCIAWSLRCPVVSRAAFADLHDFDAGSAQNGACPQANLTAVGSALYGMTTLGGASRCGAIFSINTDGTGYQCLHSFGGGPSDGANPYGSLTLVGSALYGMTSLGGASGCGAIFTINTDGTGYQLLHSFGGGTSDGANPYGSLTLSGSTLYGLTSAGGGSPGYGTIFTINTDGSAYQILYSFGITPGDGKGPYADLTLSGATLFGTTNFGGADGQGAIFKINTDGTGYQLLHSFAGGTTDGALPYGNLALAGASLYATTLYGGSGGGYGTIFKINTDGTGYQLLYGFSDGATDGASPYGSLLFSGSTFYAMTSLGGANNNGTLFAWTSPIWQNAVPVGNGWYYLDWLHYFYIDPSGWIYQQQLGWLYPQGTSTDSVWFYAPKMNAWLWTGSSAFPNLYRASDNTWLRYGQWSTNPCYFYNYTTNRGQTY